MKWLWMLLGCIIMVQPIVHPNLYIVINNDTANHLAVFKSLQQGNPTHFLYLGQQVTAYSLVWLSNLTHIGLDVLFMWFNYTMLLISGVVVGLLVTMVSKSKISGILSGVLIIFGVPSTLHLFYSGTIFDIIEILILVPIILMLIYQVVRRKKLYYLFVALALMILAYLFHPSFSMDWFGIKTFLPYENILNPLSVMNVLFGAGLIGLLVICLVVIYKIQPKVELPAKIVMLIIILMVSTMLGIGYIGITNYSTRLIFNAGMLFGILLSILLGITLTASKSSLLKGTLVSYVIVSVAPNLFHWLSFPIISR